MLSTQFVELNKPCKPKPELPMHICVTRPQWVKTEKDNELASPGDFLIKLLFQIFNLQREYYVLGLFCRKPWFWEVINISPMDQTKCFQLRTALLLESAYGCMTTRRLIIQWSQKILTIDITKVALRSKASNNSNITWMEYENNTFPIKDGPCPRVAHV